MTAHDVASYNWNAYVRARDAGHEEYVEEALRFNQFYWGKQWKDGDRTKLEGEGKPVLTTNLVLTTVNAMLGEHIAQQAEIRFKPLRGGLAELAEAVLTPLARHIQEDNDYNFVESEVLADGLIQDRGYFDVRMDFERDVNGEVRITAVDPLTVIPDPAASSFDTRQWNEVTRTWWATLDEIEVDYGEEHRKAVEMFARGGFSSGQYEGDCIEWAERESRYGDTDAYTVELDEEDARRVEQVRVIERQYRRVGVVRVFTDAETGDMEEVLEDMTDTEAETLAAEMGATLSEKTALRVRWTVTVGDHVIKDVWSPYRDFTIVAYFPYFRRGKGFGVVRNLISPQEQLNKADSQELHIINTTANSGWQVEAGQLVNMTEDELEERGAETGLVLVRRPGTNPLEKILPNQVPSGISGVAAKAASSIRSISGVNAEMLGDTPQDVSGVALEKKLGRGLVQLQVPFENLNRTRKILWEKVYQLLREYYTDERIYHVADFNTPGAPARTVEINKQMVDGTILNNIAIGEYGIGVEVGPSHNNVQETQFLEALNLRKAGVMIPDHIVVENSHLVHRREVAELLRKLNGFAEPTPEEQQLAQMQMELQMQMAMAELESTKAKAMLLQAQAMQAQAKAQALQTDPQLQALEMQTTIDLETRKLEQAREALYANLENKLELAGIHSQNKAQTTQYTTRAKQTMEEMKLSQAERLALRELAQAKNTPTTPKKAKK